MTEPSKRLPRNKPDFYITFASDYEEGIAALADEARYNGAKGKVTVFVIQMAGIVERSRRNATHADNVLKASAGGELRKGETNIITKGRDLNLIVGTALDRIRTDKKTLSICVSSDMPDAESIAAELSKLFEAMKAPKGFTARVVDPRKEGFETSERSEKAPVKSAKIIQLKLANDK